MPKKISKSRSESRLGVKYSSKKKKSVERSIGRRLSSLTVAELKSLLRYFKIPINSYDNKAMLVKKLKLKLLK